MDFLLWFLLCPVRLVVCFAGLVACTIINSCSRNNVNEKRTLTQIKNVAVDHSGYTTVSLYPIFGICEILFHCLWNSMACFMIVY